LYVLFRGEPSEEYALVAVVGTREIVRVSGVHLTRQAVVEVEDRGVIFAKQVWTPGAAIQSLRRAGRPVSVLPEWLQQLPIQQQSVLLLALRGPDGVRKDHPCKALLRYYRACVIKAARYGRMLRDTDDCDSFLGYVGWRVNGDPPAMQGDKDFYHRADAYLDRVDELPHHYHMHMMHAAQILGYKHPDAAVATRWRHFYGMCAEDAHLTIETEAQMDERLSDWNRASWSS